MVLIKLRNGEYTNFKDRDIVAFNPTKCYIKVQCTIHFLITIKFYRKVYFDKDWIYAKEDCYHCITNYQYILNGLQSGIIGAKNNELSDN